MLDWIIILGAASDIAMAVAREFARAGKNLYLAARDPEALRAFATDLEIRHNIKVKVLAFDVLKTETHRDLLGRLEPRPSAALLAAGYMGDQELAQKDLAEARRIIDTNFTGAASVLEACADYFGAQGRGSIAAISSVAGDRGRQSNYIYGSAKGALSIYLSGLRGRMAGKGVKVTTIKPGFVRTKMIAATNPPKFLVSSPERVARDIVRAMRRGQPVIYTPWFWRWIMAAIKMFPERVMMRMKD